MMKRLYRFLSPKFQTISLDYPVEAKPRYGHGLPAHPELKTIIEAEREEYKLFAQAIEANRTYFESIPFSNGSSKELELVWNNGFLPGLDIVALYSMITTHKPKRYVEIGSGNSTIVAKKAISEHQLSTQIISIDPQPRAEIDTLANEVIREPFEKSSYNLIESLESGDILFVDNSHRILPNSDSMVFYLEVLPRLKTGVIIHIHDIYLPYDYPQFMCDRYYSEQYGLACFLLANPNVYKPLFPCFFFSEDNTLSASLGEFWNAMSSPNIERHGGSFWLIKK